MQHINICWNKIVKVYDAFVRWNIEELPLKDCSRHMKSVSLKEWLILYERKSDIKGAYLFMNLQIISLKLWFKKNTNEWMKCSNRTLIRLRTIWTTLGLIKVILCGNLTLVDVSKENGRERREHVVMTCKEYDESRH